MNETAIATNNKPGLRRKIDIFISSTFIDMEVERDIIVNHIVPRMEEDLREFGVDINVVDLRWGVNTLDKPMSDEERNEKILKVCFSEIDRCQPYFIGIIGNRIGWRPDLAKLNNYVSESDWDGCCRQLGLRRPSVTALELYHALYQSDCPVDHAFVMFRDPECYGGIPDNLRKIYTEEDSDSELTGLRQSLESLFYDRNLHCHVMGYKSEWSDGILKPDTSFAESLYERLVVKIREDLEELRSKPVSWIEDEIQEQEYLAGKYVGGKYIADAAGRGKVHQEVTSLLKDDTSEVSGCVILQGESGSGKTAFAARQARLLEDAGEFVFFFSSTTSRRSFNPNNMLETFVSRLSALLGKEYNPSDGEEWLSKSERKKYSSWVSMLDVEGDSPHESLSRSQWLLQQFDMLMYDFNRRYPDKVLYIIIDCYDGFDRFMTSVHLSWLKKFHLSVLITTLPSHLGLLKENLPEASVVNMPPFNAPEAMALIKAVSRDGSKEMYRDVMDSILSVIRPDGQPAYASPLWLRLVCHILFSLNTSDFKKMRAENGSANEADIVGFLKSLIARIPPLPEEAFPYFAEKASQYIDQAFTNEVLALLAFSRFGLREKDLAVLMEERWNALNFALLRYWFRPYFTSNGAEGFWRIAHSLFAEAVRRQSDSVAVHNRLNAYLRTLPENDAYRVGEGMIHVLGGHDPYYGILSFYIHGCRHIANIMHATEDIIDYIRKDNEGLARIIDEIRDSYNGPDSDMQAQYAEIMKYFGRQRGADLDGRLNTNQSINRHLYDRVVHTLCATLVERGFMPEAVAILDVIVPMMEEDNDDAANRFLLPLCYTWLAEYYDTRYDKEQAALYRSKLMLLDKMLAESEDSEAIGNGQEYEDSRILPPEEFYRAGTEYVNGRAIDTEVWNRIEYTAYFMLEDFPKETTMLSWVDYMFALIVLCKRYAATIDDCEVKEVLDDVMQHYPGQMARLTETQPIPVNKLIHDHGNEVVEHLYYLANVLEAFSPVAYKEYPVAGEAMALDSLEIYSSLAFILDTTHAMLEWSVSAQSVSKFYQETGMMKHAVAHGVCAFNVSKKALDREPSSIRVAERYAYAAHNLGRLFFNMADYGNADRFLATYLEVMTKFHSINPETHTITSSYFIALHEYGDCLTQLGRFQEAADNYSLLINEWTRYHNHDPELASMWTYHYFSARCGIARILVEVNDSRAYNEAITLYDLMKRCGCPPDYEPMENVVEILSRLQFPL